MQADHICAKFCAADGAVLAAANHYRKHHGAADDADILAHIAHTIGFNIDSDFDDPEYICGVSRLIDAYNK